MSNTQDAIRRCLRRLVRLWRWARNVDKIEALEDLIAHAEVHGAYQRSGYRQMTTEQRALWDAVWARRVAKADSEEAEREKANSTDSCPNDPGNR